MRFPSNRAVASVLVVLVVLATTAISQSNESKKCTPMGGAVLTNLGVPDANSTMGYATGDLKGAVGVSITEPPLS